MRPLSRFAIQHELRKRRARLFLARLSDAMPGAVKLWVPALLKYGAVRLTSPEREAERPGTLFISYHKSGRTWLRAMIGKVLADRCGLPDSTALRTKLLCRAAGLPTVRWTHDGSAPLDGQPYWELDQAKDDHQDQSVVFLTRDLRDLIVSSYYAMTKRDRKFDGSIHDFVRSDVFGARRILAFYNSWYANRDKPKRFLHIRYEDMHADPMAVLRQVLDAMEVPDIDEAQLVSAVDFARFENLRSMEKADYFNSGALRPRNADDPNSFKVRRGVVAGFKHELSADDLAFIRQVEEEMGNPFA